MSDQFLSDTSARKGRWRDEDAEAAGLYTAYHFTGGGTHGLEVAYATANTEPNRTTVRDVWKQRHGRAAVPLMVVVGYPKNEPTRRGDQMSLLSPKGRPWTGGGYRRMHLQDCEETSNEQASFCVKGPASFIVPLSLNKDRECLI